ncbi:c-type cytochrome [Belliella sp. R4-6]|uniref:C-type cytochrome n=1 Tax=Belliella alkalica TaxID=1730871 RepID=A0ABS9V8H2_9BACT|nr:c-type cytochrome [Belliella alkalica]MCH7412721.1 c-type cytochrome [Belliella alkalica]
MKESFDTFTKLISHISVLIMAVVTIVILIFGSIIFIYQGGKLPEFQVDINPPSELETIFPLISEDGIWLPPDWALVNLEPNSELIIYGKELISNTSEYLGPNGKVGQISNGMNCQNCHINSGTMPLGNNYSAVFATYPKVRARSGQIEDIPKRINDCFERSLNGQPLSQSSREMIAIVAYMEWLGKDVPKGETPKGAGLFELQYLDRAANPLAGKRVYENQCKSCHGEEGQGVLRVDGYGYTYPPLWGENSYNDGAGLYRLSRFAGYVKANMPLGSTYQNPILTDEQAWDVAAYVNSMQRPQKDISMDWPDISKKPFDHPFGPYVDGFLENQHKFGPFRPIKEANTSIALK